MITTRSFIPTLDRMLTREIDRVLNTPWDNGSTSAARLWVPALDVFETAEGYTIEAELPGLSPADVELNFDRNTLTLRGTKQPTLKAQEKGEIRVYTAERVHGQFERSIRLPEYVDVDRIEARFNNGVLTIWVPKSQAAMPRKIEISVANDQKVEGAGETKQINR